MRDQRLDKLADVLVRYSTEVKRGDLVGITGDPIAMPLIEATYEAVLRVGGHPFFKPRCDSLDDIKFSIANDEQLAYFPQIEMDYINSIDVHIGFWAETNTRSKSGVDPKRLAIAQQSSKAYMARFLDRVAEKELRWVGTLFPTLASAQDGEMSLRDYEEFVFRAGYLHLDDPAAMWRQIQQRQERVREWLQTRHELHFQVAPHDGHDGTDLRVNADPAKSVWINCAGDQNFPDGEVFTAPQGADGHVNYTFPAVYRGREVEGVRLAFKDGRVTDAIARKNEAFLIEMLDQDDGARNLGEIAIGTNYAIKDFTRNTLFDEKIGGTFHAAVGAAYPESGGNNQSALHWDMVCELRERNGSPGGTIAADGEVFHQNGAFLQDGWPSDTEPRA